MADPQSHSAAEAVSPPRGESHIGSSSTFVTLPSQQGATAPCVNQDRSQSMNMVNTYEFDKDPELQELIGKIIFTFKGGGEEWEGIDVKVDSGSSFSLISHATVRFLKLKPRPLLPHDVFSISSPFNQNTAVKITHYVSLTTKCTKLDLEKVDISLSIADGDWEILVGNRFMNKHNLWKRIGKLLEIEKLGERETLLALRSYTSKAQKKSDDVERERQRVMALKLEESFGTWTSSTKSIASSNSDWATKVSSVSSQGSSAFGPLAAGKR